MSVRTLFARAFATAIPLLAMSPAAQAQQQTYHDMCVRAADMPAAYGGESDLKGNPKYPAYCDCFIEKFSARAQKAALYMQANPGKAPPGTAEEVAAQELAMRNSCRKQLGLPAALDPNKAGAPAAGQIPGMKRK
jgi:hypothetical protein